MTSQVQLVEVVLCAMTRQKDDLLEESKPSDHGRRRTGVTRLTVGNTRRTADVTRRRWVSLGSRVSLA